MYRFLHGHVFFFILGKYLGVGLLGCMVKCMFHFTSNSQIVFLKWLYHFAIYVSSASSFMRIVVVPCPSQHLVVSGFLFLSPSPPPFPSLSSSLPF